MAGSASLVVKISADINDFSRQLNTATRAVDQASKKIENLGKALTLGITVPVLGAAAALAKMAAENEDTGARLERVFGSAATSVNASIQQMMKSVPEANTDLQKMAITVDNMAQGLGLAPAKAAQMSESLLKLAGDASAFAHVPMSEALDALSRGLAGKTKGLLQFGIAINEADIKQRAYQMGLLHTGNDLTETGTALAAYSLIMERSTRIQGEAANTATQMGKQFAFLKRDLSELADNVSGIVLPSISGLAKSARDVTAVFAALDQGTVKVFFSIAAGAAIIGPLIVGFARIVDVAVKVRAAFALLSAGGTVAGFVGALAALPITTIVAGIVAITAALGGLYLIWRKFSSDSAPAASIPLASVGTITHQATGILPPSVGKNDPTERASGTPLEQFKRRADAITKGFDAAVEHGKPIEGMLGKINSLHTDAARLIRGQGGAFNETAQAAQEVLDKVQQIKNAIELANAKTPEAQQGVLTRIARDQQSGFNAKQQAASDVAKETFDKARDLEVRLAKIQLPSFSAPQSEAVVQSLEGARAKDQALALREALLKLPDGFNAAREAAVEFGESQRQYVEDLKKRLILSQQPSTFNAGAEAQVRSNESVKGFGDDIALRQALLKLPDGFNAAQLASVEFAESQRATSESVALKYETLKLQLDQFGIHLGNASARVQVATGVIFNAAISFAQQLVANAGGGGKGAGIGRGLGGLAGGIAGALLGPAGSAAGALIGSTIGGVIGTGLGGLVGGLFDHPKKASDTAANSLDALAKTVDRVTASITNIPAFFKVEYYRFTAAPVKYVPTPQAAPSAPYVPPKTQPTNPTPVNPDDPNNPSNPSPTNGGTPNGNMIFTGDIHLPNVTDAQSFVRDMRAASLKARGRGGSANFAFGGAF